MCQEVFNGKWRIVYAYNKLKSVTISAQTPIPRSDILQSNMVGFTMYSALDLFDGYYLLLMRDKDLTLIAIRIRSGMC